MKIAFFEDDPNLEVSQKMYLYVDSDLDTELTKFIDIFVNEEEFIINMDEYLEIDDNVYKFYIELIDEINLEVLKKRGQNVSKINVNLKKLKWMFSSDTSLCIKIGKIQNKDIYIHVCEFEDPQSTEMKLKILGIKDKILDGTYVSPKELQRLAEEKENELILDEDDEDDVKEEKSNKSNKNEKSSLNGKNEAKNIKRVLPVGRVQRKPLNFQYFKISDM